MHLFNKILLVLIFLTGVFYLVLVSNRYNLGKEWEEKLAKQDKTIADLTADIGKLDDAVNGVPLKSGEEWAWKRMGLVAQSEKLSALLSAKVWINCLPGNLRGLDEESRQITVSFTASPEALTRQYDGRSLGDKNFFYVFDSGIPYSAPVSEDGSDAAKNLEEGDQEASAPQRPVFLGIFSAENVDPESKTYNLASVGTISESQKERIKDSVDSGRGWIVYEDRLPVDSPKDIAYWIQNYPDDAFVKWLNTPSDDSDENSKKEADKAYFSRTSVSQINEAGDEKGFVDGGVESDSGLVGDNERYAIKYDTHILKKYYQIDKLNLLLSRGARSKGDLDVVIADQLAMLGCDAVPTESADPATAEVFKGISEECWNETVDRFQKLGDESLNELERLLPESKSALNRNASDSFEFASFLLQKRNAVKKFETMCAQRDLVKARLDTAEKSKEQLQSRINELVRDNARVAKSIADVQFQASSEILRRANNVTASVD